VVADHVGAQVGGSVRAGQGEIAGGAVGSDAEQAGDEQRRRHDAGQRGTRPRPHRWQRRRCTGGRRDQYPC
jgi:hypothetical protein